MVRWMRSVNIGQGRYMEAMGWGKEMAAYGEKAWGVKIRVFLDVFGDVTTVRWMVDNADLASTEKSLEKVMSDQEYFKRVGQAFSSGLFIDGTTRDVVTREL
jgi:hypothetical protein